MDVFKCCRLCMDVFKYDVGSCACDVGCVWMCSSAVGYVCVCSSMTCVRVSCAVGCVWMCLSAVGCV